MDFEPEETPFEHLHLVSEVRELGDRELYNIISKEIEIIHDFFSLDESNLNKEFDKYLSLFNAYAATQPNGFVFIILLMEYFLSKRPKLAHCILTLFSHFRSISYDKEEIDNYIHQRRYTTFFYNRLDKLIVSNEDLEQVDVKECFFSFCTKESSQTIETLLSIIFDDEPDDLVAFQSDNPTYDIHKNINITESDILKFITDTFSSKQISLLEISCLLGSAQCFKYCLMNQFKITKETAKYAIKGGNSEIIQILNQQDVKFNNCFEVSVEFHRYHLTDWLITHFECERIQLSKCVRYYNYEAFIYLFQNGEFLKEDTLDYSLGETYFSRKQSLHVACHTGCLPLAQYLLKHCNIEAKDLFVQRTPIQSACQGCHIPMIKYLISLGAVKETKNSKGWSLLHIACNECFLPLVEYFIQLGLNIDEPNNKKWTPLHLACQKGYLPNIQYLVSHGADIEKMTSEGMNALHIACFSGHREVVEYLITQGCDKEKKELILGRTPLLIACFNRHLSIVEYLISQGCSKEAKTDDGLTALHIACEKGCLNIVEYLVSNGCQTDAKTNDGKTPIEYANQSGFSNIVDFLNSHKSNY